MRGMQINLAENVEYIAASPPLDRHTTQPCDYIANNNPTSRLYNLNNQTLNNVTIVRNLTAL